MANLGESSHQVRRGAAVTPTYPFNGNVDVSGNVDIGGTLTVDGAATISGNLTTEAGLIHKLIEIDHTDSPYTIPDNVHVIHANTDGGAISMVLPAGINGTEYEWYNVGSSGNDLDVDPNGSETLLGGAAGVAAVFADTEGALVKYGTSKGWR